MTVTRIEAELRIDYDLRLPPAVDLIVTRNADERLYLAVAGIPTDTTLAQFIFTSKAHARDADSAITLQKTLTTGTAIDTVGQITDDGASGVALVTLPLIPGDYAALPDTGAFQCWGIVIDAGDVQRQGPCLLGALRVRPPIPTVLP